MPDARAALPALLALLATSGGLQAQESDVDPVLHPGFLLPTVDGGFGGLAEHLDRPLVVLHFASW